VIVSHGFWSSRFAGSSDALRKILTLNGISYEVVGVAPPDFDDPEKAELWIPRRMDLESCARGCHTMPAKWQQFGRSF